jgi:solute carrier family 25 (mitochondrial phosphate transporter), member 23/24/25/41
MTRSKKNDIKSEEMTDSNKSSIQNVHYYHELAADDEERLEKLFKKLDVDGNGRIDIHDLSVSLKEFGLNPEHAKVREHS